MATATPTATQLYTAISSLKQKKGSTIAWKEIMSAITSSGLVIKNWMVVRSALQGVINDGLLTRTQDVKIEEYRWN